MDGGDLADLEVVGCPHGSDQQDGEDKERPG